MEVSDFIDDPEASDMFITGAAGTGKTTNLAKDIEYCIANGVKYVVCAYTHKACGILRSKLPAEALVMTLHSFLGKRPCMNTNAIKKEHVDISTKAIPKETSVLFIDEYSMIGEKDYVDIVGLDIKVVWIGDAHQLPPVGDMQAIVPYGDYQVLLTKQYRNDNPLQGPLQKLISYIEGATPAPLEPVPGYFERGANLVTAEGDVVLAFTNRRVQELNALRAGKELPESGDKVFNSTTKQTYTFLGWVMDPDYIDMPHGDPLHLGSKYKTLEGLRHCEFAELEDEEGDVYQFAIKFGHYNFKIEKEELRFHAVESNLAIGPDAAKWAKENWRTPKAKARAKAWRECLSFNDCVCCVDFNHAMTVHKSQGSTYHTVLVDTDDIGICANKNFALYLKLLYVAISRASHKVITS